MKRFAITYVRDYGQTVSTYYIEASSMSIAVAEFFKECPALIAHMWVVELQSKNARGLIQ